MLPEKIKNKLEGYGKERRHKKDNWGKKGTIVDTIKKRKLRLFGNICRMNDKRLIKRTIFTKIDGKLRKDRPCRKWLDAIKDWCGRSGQDLLHLARDRQV